MITLPRVIRWPAIKPSLLIAVVAAGFTGCAVTAEQPVFGPAETVKIEGFEGIYFLYDPRDEDFDKELVASVSDGELELVNVSECKQTQNCFWKAIVVRLPTSRNSYAVQIPVSDSDEAVAFIFVQGFGDYGVACVEIDKRRYQRQIEQLRRIAAASGLEVESRNFNPVYIGGNPQAERMLRFLDEAWSQLPLNAWSCYGLIPDGKPVDGIEEILNRTAFGALRAQ